MANEVENAGAGVFNWFVRQLGQLVGGTLNQSGIAQGVLRDVVGSGQQRHPGPRPDGRGMSTPAENSFLEALGVRTAERKKIPSETGLPAGAVITPVPILQPTAQPIQTDVDPGSAFTRASAEEAASTSKPSPTAAVDSLIEQAKGSDSVRLETLTRARAQIAKIGEPAP
jgi:hypothetical protein